MPFDITYLENEITDQYLHDDNPRPWIIGFSGGKDSTLLLQLVWNALSKIKDVAWTREVYVVCNDTLVENPRIVDFIERTLKRVEKGARLAHSCGKNKAKAGRYFLAERCW